MMLPDGSTCPVIAGEFWTARQRQMHPLHYAVSYRASFKAELPHFFIEKYSEPGQIVLDPFAGRGTTALETNLLSRVAWSSDASPLSERLVYSKTHPVSMKEVEARIAEIPFDAKTERKRNRKDLSPFYHPRTLREIEALKTWLRSHRKDADCFIELIALSRLHGHSPGFFSVYSFPQISVTPQAQRRINQKRGQKPAYRNVPELILRKARRVLGDESVLAVRGISKKNRHWVTDARTLKGIPAGKVDLIVTSPPFLNKADYILDNWLENWFLGIDPESYRKLIVQTPDLDTWESFMDQAIGAMHRVLRPGGHAVIEVGEVESDGERINLDECIARIAHSQEKRGLPWKVKEVLIQTQNFTKLANCFAVENNKKGTNTNRMVVMEKLP